MNASTYLQAPPQRKLLGLAGVVVLHALLVWAVQAGLGRTVVEKMPQVVQALLLEDIQPPPPPAPPPPAPAKAPPARTPPPAYVPPAVTPAVSDAPNAIAAVSTTPAPAPPTAATTAAAASPAPGPAGAARAPVRTAAGVNLAACEKPEYPSASRRMEEEGTVILRFLVGADGRILQAEVEKSSGYKRLDEAARAGLAKCQFKPALVDGKPEQAWANIKYTWRLE